MKVIKEIQWDMGHRVTNHHSQCRNLHGHRYRAEICVEGNLVNITGISDEGMVIDFGDIKKIATEQVHDVLDHGFMVWDKDKVLTKFFNKNKDQKHLVVPFVPTSENIAAWIFNQLDKHIKDKYGTGLRLYSIKLWETPTSSAVYTRRDVEKLKDKL
jgi:6-pyruvoyltetrahydropterin/6-carboxytetrahydropterin synthase